MHRSLFIWPFYTTVSSADCSGQQIANIPDIGFSLRMLREQSRGTVSAFRRTQCSNLQSRRVFIHFSLPNFEFLTWKYSLKFYEFTLKCVYLPPGRNGQGITPTRQKINEKRLCLPNCACFHGAIPELLTVLGASAYLQHKKLEITTSSTSASLYFSKEPTNETCSASQVLGTKASESCRAKAAHAIMMHCNQTYSVGVTKPSVHQDSYWAVSGVILCCSLIGRDQHLG